jgi:hypothetical protein
MHRGRSGWLRTNSLGYRLNGLIEPTQWTGCGTRGSSVHDLKAQFSKAPAEPTIAIVFDVTAICFVMAATLSELGHRDAESTSFISARSPVVERGRPSSTVRPQNGRAQFSILS